MEGNLTLASPAQDEARSVDDGPGFAAGVSGAQPVGPVVQTNGTTVATQLRKSGGEVKFAAVRHLQAMANEISAITEQLATVGPATGRPRLISGICHSIAFPLVTAR